MGYITNRNLRPKEKPLLENYPKIKIAVIGFGGGKDKGEEHMPRCSVCGRVSNPVSELGF